MRTALLQSLARSGFAVRVFTRSGAVLHTCARLETLLRQDQAQEIRESLEELVDLLPMVGPGLTSADGGLDLRASRSLRCGADWYRAFLLEMAPGLLAAEGTVVAAFLHSWGLPVTPCALRSRFRLTAREADIAFHVARGRSTKGIASALGISTNTARNHTARLFSKLGVGSRAEAAALLVGELLRMEGTKSGEPAAAGPRP